MISASNVIAAFRIFQKSFVRTISHKSNSTEDKLHEKAMPPPKKNEFPSTTKHAQKLVRLRRHKLTTREFKTNFIRLDDATYLVFYEHSQAILVFPSWRKCLSSFLVHSYMCYLSILFRKERNKERYAMILCCIRFKTTMLRVLYEKIYSSLTFSWGCVRQRLFSKWVIVKSILAKCYLNDLHQISIWESPLSHLDNLYIIWSSFQVLWHQFDKWKLLQINT